MGGILGTAIGPTWQFTVGARSAAVNTSFGTTLDVNGDGYADVAIGAYCEPFNAGACGPGRAHIYLGSATGLPGTPATSLTGPNGAGGVFGISVASAGDVNGDGYPDLVVGARDVGAVGRAYVYLGGAAGLSGTPATTLIGSVANGSFGISVASAGDVNGDGYADVAVGANSDSTATGHAYVYLGSAAGLSATVATTFTGPSGAGGSFGTSVASAGDVNGDGYADLAVGAFGVATGVGRVYLYVGSAAGLSGTPTTTLAGLDGTNSYFGYSVAGAGDVNGDGYADLAVGSGLVDRARVYLGSAAGLSGTPATTLSGPVAGGFFGFSVAGAGDVNGDGYADLTVGASGESGGTGRAYVYLGSAAGLSGAPATTLTGVIAGGQFGGSVAGAGDVNGDGFADVAVGANREISNRGGAYLFLGAAAGLSATPARTLTGFDAGNFGYSVACADDPSDPEWST